MDVSYEYYKIFYYVAKFRSFTKAANALYANQPNVTRAIKNLESALNCPLFVRSSRSVTLTPEGEKLFARVKIAVENIQAGEEELALDRSLQGGTVAIGATENTLHYVLLPLMKEFRKRYAGISVKVTNFNTAQAIAALKNGQVDFSVVTSPVHLPRYLRAVDIRAFREYAVAGAAFVGLKGKRLSLRDLQSVPLVSMGSETMTYEFYMQYFYENGATLAPTIEVASTDQILSMVKNDLGVGFVPEYFLRDPAAGRGLIVLDVQPPVPERSICFIKRTDQPLSLAAKQFEKIILQKSAAGWKEE